MPTDILAKGRFVPISAQKVRLVVDLVRGNDAVEALSLLQFTTNRAAHPRRERRLMGAEPRG